MNSNSSSRVAPQDGRAKVAGVTETALVDLTIGAFFKRTVSQFADCEAAVFCESGFRFTYQELDKIVDQFAAGLLATGLYKGDRIGIWSPNRSEWLIAQLASARIGLILVNINPAWQVTELEVALNKVGAKALIVARRFKHSNYIEMLRKLAPATDVAKPGHLRAQKLPSLKVLIQLGHSQLPGFFSFDDIVDKGHAGNISRLDAIGGTLSPNDAINIQFTSGTTGEPKGATLTHRNIINNAIFCGQAMALTEQDRICIAVPLYHCFGMVLGNLAAIASGSTMVFPSEGFDAERTLKALDEESCTAIHGVPTMFQEILDHQNFRKFKIKSLRTGIMAGALCPESLMQRVVSELRASEITIAYGMTETSPVSFQSDVNDSIKRRVSTVGRIHPHVEVKIVDPAGQTVAVNEIGELYTRGYSVMQGYWNDQIATRDAIDKDGWMHTGDLATLDEAGYCDIAGRVKDMVIRGGENIYPREVENFLTAHPAVHSVSVFGVPDPQYGEQLCAWIVLQQEPMQSKSTLDEEGLKQYCRGKIAHYKIPHHVRFVAALPMTVTGKPQKFRMIEAMISELGL